MRVLVHTFEYKEEEKRAESNHQLVELKLGSYFSYDMYVYMDAYCIIESGFGVHLGSYSPPDHRWILSTTVRFFQRLMAI
jgi:hypothetical protein